MAILQKMTIKDQIYNLIKERIFSQTYKQGEKINMMELSQELGVSNSPIREALSLLESEGLIVFSPNAGPRVIRMDQTLFAEVQETARILLLGCYEECMERNLKLQLVERIEEIIEKQKAAADDFSEAGETEFARLAISFDVSVMTVLGNKTLERLYAAFYNQLFLVVLYDHKNSARDRQKNIAEHEHILEAVRSGDYSEVRRGILEHFSRPMETAGE